uniref:Putative plexins functional semaphorin receptor n=1 Tax=Ixodes scapularis TaxID=6945 RepID=A0A4D5RUF8_IXOSC
MGAPRSRAALGFLPLLLAVLMGSRVSAKNGVDLFVSSTLRTWANVSRMVVDKDTGKVYVGGANRIYQLTPNLETESLAFMGPYRDSSHCSPTSGCLPGQEKMRDYHTKAMAIDYSTKSLVVCGNVIRGSCTLHSLQNVSDFQRPSHESVLSSDPNESAVLFISNGPGPHKQVLYVGSSWNTEGSHAVDVPAVSSRSLDPNKDTFSIAVQGERSGTRIFVNSASRTNFPISYIFGFEFRGFSYWLTVQKSSLEEGARFISKLVRVCQNDPNYHSYTEVELVCRSDKDAHYNLAQAGFVSKPGSDLADSLGYDDDVLFVVFAKSENETIDRPGNESALCLFPLEAVMRNFTENIRDCFKGEGNRGLDFITPSTPCQNTPVSITDLFCGLEVNTPLEGSKPITAKSALSYTDTQLTSVAATTIYNFTAVFLGTNRGHLKKVLLESATSGYEVDDIAVDEGNPVLRDMLFDGSKDRIYVMTDYMLSAVDVQQCFRYLKCGVCTSNRDPYCGWCGPEKKCSLRANCEEAADDPVHWLSYKTQCSPITNISPSEVQRSTIRQLNVKLTNKTFVDEEELVCIFATSGLEVETNATRSADGVACPTPKPDAFSSIPSEDPYLTMKLSVGRNMTPEYFKFFDCNAYKTCTECTSTASPCSWCIERHLCTHNSSENCLNDITLTSPGAGPSIRGGADLCPRIQKSSSSSNEIIVPKSTTLGIRIQVENIPAFMIQSRFVCQFLIEGKIKQVNGQLLGDSLYCGRIPFKYDSDDANTTTKFGVIWEPKKFLDNPDNIHVVVYDCAKMAQNCGECHELHEKYGCGWCQESKSCTVRSNCPIWIDRTHICPDPEIMQFYPNTGPLEGGTNITIEGENFGKMFEDIQQGVHISLEMVNGSSLDVPCVPYQELYVRGSRIVCRIQRPENMTLATSGPVVVSVQDQFKARSKQKYTFVDPTIVSITPDKGPKSGGTDIEIRGAFLNTGSTAEISVGGVPCHLTERQDALLTCRTSQAPMAGRERLVVKFDNGLRVLGEYMFTFVEDPVIDSVESAITGTPARGIPRNVSRSHPNT